MSHQTIDPGSPARPHRPRVGGRDRPAPERAISAESRKALSEAARGLGAWIPPEVVRGAVIDRATRRRDQIKADVEGQEGRAPVRAESPLHRPTLALWRAEAERRLLPPERDEGHLEPGRMRREVRRAVVEWKSGFNFLVGGPGGWGLNEEEDD